jgi:hypothetical protein
MGDAPCQVKVGNLQGGSFYSPGWRRHVAPAVLETVDRAALRNLLRTSTVVN